MKRFKNFVYRNLVCPECNRKRGEHEEWCSIGSWWLPEWWKHWQMRRWEQLSLKQWQRGRWFRAIAFWIAVIGTLYWLTGCAELFVIPALIVTQPHEVVSGLRMANNPNNWDHQWDHDPCNPNYKPASECWRHGKEKLK